jgi:hypothetical protein
MEKKSNTSTNENLKALGEIIKRIKLSLDNKETTNLKFTLDIHKGLINTVTWNMDKEFNFDDKISS